MKSNFLNTAEPGVLVPQLAGLDSENWLIDTYYNKLKITGKNDSYPYSINVEIYTDSNEGWGFVCPDLFVVVRSAGSNQVYASKYVSTHRDWQSCSGESTIIFNTAFKGNKNELLKIEIYQDHVETLADAENATPIAVSPLFKLSNSGIINKPSQDEGSGDFFGDTGQVLKYGTILLTVGAGAYFLAPFAPLVKDGFENISQRIKTAVNE